MNKVLLLGRLTKDPKVSESSTGMAITSFCVAIDRPTSGEEKKADFPMVKVFGKQAEICGRYLYKGRKVCIEGSLQTSKYEKNNETVYATEVIASKVEFVDAPKHKGSEEAQANGVPEGYEEVNAETPF